MDPGEGGRRPFIVVSQELLNRGRYVVAVPCTTSNVAGRRKYPNCVYLPAGSFGMTNDCVAQCENILQIPKSQLEVDAGPIGVLDDATYRDLVRAIGFVIGSDCEPE